MRAHSLGWPRETLLAALSTPTAPRIFSDATPHDSFAFESVWMMWPRWLGSGAMRYKVAFGTSPS
ncbi:hypothetical protein ABIA13_005881 [Sinorhizobium fredii]